MFGYIMQDYKKTMAEAHQEGGEEAVNRAQHSYTGGMLGMGSGALTGATIGSVVPVVGTAIGMVVGGICGSLVGSKDRDGVDNLKTTGSFLGSIFGMFR